jgi:hypothetical protein
MADDKSEDRYSRFTYGDEDSLEVYNLEDLEIVKPKKAVTASAIKPFSILPQSEPTDDEEL